MFNRFSACVGGVREAFRIALVSHSNTAGVMKSAVTTRGTRHMLARLMRLTGQKGAVARRGMSCTVSLMFRSRRRTLISVSGSLVYRALRKGPVGPGALNRGGCISTVQGKVVAFNLKPTKAKGACLTVTVTVATFGHRRMDEVVLAHPTVRTKRGLKFLPNSLRDGVSPCLEPLCSTLCRVVKTSDFLGGSRGKLVRITPLTCVHKHALSGTFVVLSRTRGAAPTRVGVFLAEVNFKSGIIVANSSARGSLPSKAVSKLSITMGIMGSLRKVGVYALADGSIMERPLIRGVMGTCRSCRGGSSEPERGEEGGK